MRVTLIQGIALARPIAGATEPFQLLDDDAAVFILPFENAPQKLFPAEIVARFVFSPPQIFFNRSLRSDPCVIHPRQPKHLEALHARPTTENVLDRVVQNVAERKHAGDVWRRHHD